MPSLKRVVVTDHIVEPLDVERSVLETVASVEALDLRSASELDGRIEDADALMVYHYVRLGREIIERLQTCRVIVRPGVGFDNIDIVAARERGIPVCNVPDYGTEEVADSTLGMALSLARGIHHFDTRLRRGNDLWSPVIGAPIHRLRDQVYFIVGLGRIGSAVAVRAKAFGFDVAFYDPYVKDGLDKALGIRRVERLEEGLSSAMIVSLHCPLDTATRHLIDAPALAALPRGAFLVNTARGGVVDSAAVVDALASGRLGGAALDVLEQEPPDPQSPLIRAWRDPHHPAHDRLILNPHGAFYSEEGTTEFRRKGALEVRRALLGEPLRNVVNQVFPS